MSACAMLAQWFPKEDEQTEKGLSGTLECFRLRAGGAGRDSMHNTE